MRAAIYTRTNRKGHDGSTDLDQQRAACEAWITEHGGEVVGVFSDEGVSASKYARTSRPEFEKLIQLLNNNHDIDTVVATDLTRFSRNVGDMLILRDALRYSGVKLAVNGQVYDPDELSGMLAPMIMSLIGESESVSRSEAVRRGKRAAKERHAHESETLREARAALTKIKRELDDISDRYAKGMDPELADALACGAFKKYAPGQQTS